MSLPAEQNWLVLHHLITDLNKKGYEIPEGINPEMGLIRSTVSSYKRDPSHPELINGLAKAEMSLNNIQGTLLTIAEEEGDFNTMAMLIEFMNKLTVVVSQVYTLKDKAEQMPTNWDVFDNHISQWGINGVKLGD